MRRALVVALATVAACGSPEAAAPRQSDPGPLTTSTAASAAVGLLAVEDYVYLLRFAHEAKVRPGDTLHVVGTCRWLGGLDSAVVSFGASGRPVASGKPTPDSVGNFSLDIAVPADLEPGSYNVVAGCSGNDRAVKVDQGYGIEVQVALDAAPEPRPVLDFVAQTAGGSVRVAQGARLDRLAVPVGGTVRGAGQCLLHTGPLFATYAVQIAGWKPADFFGLPLITEGPTGPNGEFSFEAPLPTEIPAGSYSIAVSCGRCSEFAGCGVGFAFQIGDPPPDTTTTTPTTTTTKITTTATGSAAGFTG